MVPGASRSIRLLHPIEGFESGLDNAESAIKKFAVKTLADIQEGLRIPLVGRVAAGAPILASEHVETEYQIDAGLFPNPPDYLLKVRGMSMRDIGILHDDLLAVKRLYGGLADARDGQIVVARLENEVTVKRLQRDGSQVLLLPENPDFQPIVVDPERDFLEIEGLGIGVIRNPRAGL
jgi:repressor LexA